MDEVTADTSLLMGTPPITERITAVRFYKKNPTKRRAAMPSQAP
jgi:hypothetical protein